MTNGWRTVLAVAALLGAPAPVMAQQAQAPADMDNGGEPGPKFSVTMDLEVFGKPVHVEYVDQCLKFKSGNPKAPFKTYYAPRYGGFRIDTDQAAVIVAAPHMCLVPTMYEVNANAPDTQRHWAMPMYGHQIFPLGSSLILVRPKSAPDTLILPLSHFALIRGDAGVRLISSDALIPVEEGGASNVEPLRMRDLLERRVPGACYLSWVIALGQAGGTPILKNFAEAATEDVTTVDRSEEMRGALQSVLQYETVEYLFKGVNAPATERWWIWVYALQPTLSHALAGFWTMPDSIPFFPIDHIGGQQETTSHFQTYHPESLFHLNENADGVLQNNWDDNRFVIKYKRYNADVCDEKSNATVRFIYDYINNKTPILDASVYDADVYYLKRDRSFFMAAASRLLIPIIE